MSRREVVVTACLASIAAWAVPSLAAPVSFKVPLTGAQQVPPVKTAASQPLRGLTTLSNELLNVEPSFVTPGLIGAANSVFLLSLLSYQGPKPTPTGPIPKLTPGV